MDSDEDGVPLELCGRDYYVDSDEILDYLFNKDKNSGYIKKRHLSGKESDDIESEDDDDNLSSI